MAGAKAAIHGMNLAFHDQGSDAVLLVVAIIAFNLLIDKQLFITSGIYALPLQQSSSTPIVSPLISLLMVTPFFVRREQLRVTPWLCPMYALAILPLIRCIADNVQQVWYADDATATGSLKNLCTWWDKLVTVGPSYGYFVNAVKTWFIKEEIHTEALNKFQDTQIHITKEGKPHLVAALGTTSYITEFVKAKIKNWLLVDSIVNAKPHAAFSALTHSLASRWVYVARTISNIGHLLQPLEELLRTKFIPSLTGRAALERELLALPACLGGLGLLNPSHLSTIEYSASMKVTQPLIDLIIKQDEKYGYEILQDQHSVKTEVHKSK